MKIYKHTLLLILCLAIGLSSYAKPKKKLQLKLKKGEVYEMTTNMDLDIDQEMMGQQIEVNQDMEIIVSLTVEDILKNKNFLLSYNYDTFSIDMDAMGNKMSFSSENPDESNPASKFLKKITEVELKMEITPSGKIENIEGFEDLSQTVGSNPQLAQMLKMFSDEASFRSTLDQTFSYLPQTKVSVGDRWDSSYKMSAPIAMDIDMTYEVAEIQKKLVILNVDSDINSNTTMEQAGVNMDIELEGTQKGEMSINAKDGMISSSNINQLFSMNMKMKNPQTNEDMEIPMEMNSTIVVSVTKK